MVNKIDKNSAVPLYYQLKEFIQNEIESGNYNIGDKLPTEKEFCEKFDLSRITVRNALKDLENKGLVIRKRSHGTFVSMPQLIQGPKDLKSFTEDIKSLGFEPSTEEISREVLDAKGIIANSLRLRNSEKVISLKRLRLANNEPMGIQETFLPFDKFKKILEEKKIESLYNWMNEELNIEVKYAIETYRAVTLDNVEAKLLKVSKESPAFYVERCGYDNDRNPIEFVKSLMRADKYQISINLFKK